MTTLAFYQVQDTMPAGVDTVLPPLLSKAIDNSPVLVIAPTATRAQRLDEGLWGGLGNLGPSSFLPHGTPAKGRPDRQPVLLINLEEDADCTAFMAHHKGPRLPIVLAGAESALAPLLTCTPEKICYLFSAMPADVERARLLYQQHKAAGQTLQYYKQENGRWVGKV